MMYCTLEHYCKDCGELIGYEEADTLTQPGGLYRSSR